MSSTTTLIGNTTSDIKYATAQVTKSGQARPQQQHPTGRDPWATGSNDDTPPF